MTTKAIGKIVKAKARASHQEDNSRLVRFNFLKIQIGKHFNYKIKILIIFRMELILKLQIKKAH
jgi:hypothetical protein